MKIKEFKIGSKKVGQNNPCFISLEIGGTWTSFSDAKKLIRESAKSGADAVKFQLFLPGETNKMIKNKDLKMNFKTSKGEKSGNIFDILQKRELTKSQWKNLVDYSHKLGVSFICTANFPETIDFLKKIKADAIKISKGDINNVLLINHAAKKKLPIILDGREKISDIDKAVKICEKNHNKKILIMHCPSGYPAEAAGVHLSAISKIKSKYPYPVGYADHSQEDIMNYAAVGLGAKMLEKTITSNKKTQEIEHLMSLEIGELSTFVKNIREIEEAMGDPKILFRSRVNEETRRSLIAKETIQKGEKISSKNITFQRPGNLGISASEGLRILNKKANCLIEKGTSLKPNMIKNFNK